MVGKGTTRRQTMQAFAALTAIAGFPALTAAAPAANSEPAAQKLFAIVVRKAGQSPDEFRRHWIAAQADRALDPGDLRGLVLSEAFGAGADAMPAASYGHSIDGFAQYWLDREAMPATVHDLEGDGWIDRDASRSYLLREEIVVPPPRVEGLVKRTLLLARRPDLTHRQFVDHWLTRHAELARGVPGLAGAVFNPVLRDMDAESSPWREIDGITETWWHTSGDDIGGKVPSREADEWMGDADNFLDLPRCRTIASIEHVLIAPHGRT